LVGVGFLVYGLGIGPGYYSWGFFAPEIIDDLGLTREQVGQVFGVFTLMNAGAGPLTAWGIRRFGLRGTVTVGALICAVGFFLTSRAQSVGDIFLSYSVIGGTGIALSTVLPAQTLPVYWFRRYRARATAIILMGAGIVGASVTPIDELILRLWDWRMGWVLISCTSLFVALLAAVFYRNRPEDVGQRRDGRPPTEDEPLQSASTGVADRSSSFTWVQAVRTPQFLIALFAAATNTLPWRVLTAHGRLHLEDLGFASTAAAAILGVRVGVSALGRLSGSAGDFIPPRFVFALALAINGLGVGLFALAESPPLAYLSVCLMGFGYGAGYLSISIVFARLFGREAFVETGALRVAIAGVVSYFAPTWAGASADATGSYSATLLVLMILCLVGAAAIVRCRRPQAAHGP
jgi:MFS family permease